MTREVCIRIYGIVFQVVPVLPDAGKDPGDHLESDGVEHGKFVLSLSLLPEVVGFDVRNVHAGRNRAGADKGFHPFVA